MAENPPFVINDRRKFTADGDVRPDFVRETRPAEAPREPIAFPGGVSESARAADEPRATRSEPIAFPSTTAPQTAPEPVPAPQAASEDDLPPPPTAEQTAQVGRAYDATVDRLDTALRASDPGAERVPPMSFDRFIQSLYMQALLQLGGAAEPGQQPQVDILGARQTIDMLAILAEKTKGNLSSNEEALVSTALFELRMGFLEVTQAFARQAAARQGGPGMPGAPGSSPGFGGPQVVR